MEVLLNPRSRRYSRSIQPLVTAHHGLTPVVTHSATHMKDLLRSARQAGVERIAIGGGDGTVHEALQTLAGGDTELGIVPLGAGNDFARACGIPLSPRRALRLIGTGQASPTDLGTLRTSSGVYRFGTVASVGFDVVATEIAQRFAHAHPWTSHRLGRWIYPIAALGAALRFRQFICEVAGDEGERRRESLLLLAVANGRSYGGGLCIAPRAQLDDGRLDLVIVAPRSLVALLWQLPLVYFGRHLWLPGVRSCRIATAEIRGPELAVFADGEACGKLPVVIGVDRDAIRVVKPAGKPIGPP
jgi:diacylglycerol kinase (ATP)